MDKTVSAADANRKFSQLLKNVRQGRSYVVTSHGQPVARISPLQESGPTVISARRSLLQRLQLQPPVNAGRWKRDELYEDSK
jgi:prevent-host-death family protein